MRPRDFNQRLQLACDNLPEIVPPYGHGRQVYVARKLKVTQEAVRKWFTGDARPKMLKMRELAKLLEVDEAWLSLGIEPETDRREKRVHSEKTEGAIYVAFGLLTMAGGHCAFPGSNDPRAEYVDFYSIIRGQQKSFHVSIGREMSKGVYVFNVPAQYNDTISIGAIPIRGFRIHFIELKHALIEIHKQRKGSGFQVIVSKTNATYTTGKDSWPQLQDIGDLI